MNCLFWTLPTFSQNQPLPVKEIRIDTRPGGHGFQRGRNRKRDRISRTRVRRDPIPLTGTMWFG
jgi:hypothetical protein